jgi:hypothetical protein
MSILLRTKAARMLEMLEIVPTQNYSAHKEKDILPGKKTRKL